MNKNLKNNLIVMSIGILSLFVITLSVSYAYYQVTLTSPTSVNATAAKFTTSFADGKAINMTNTEPMKDSDGLMTNGYSFTLNNTGNITLNYDVYLNISSYTLPLDLIKFSISNNDTYSSPVLLSSFTLDNNRIKVYSGSLDASKSASHTIKLWLTEGADASSYNKTFNATISVVSSQTNAE